jgi:hypothetical protein
VTEKRSTHPRVPPPRDLHRAVRSSSRSSASSVPDADVRVVERLAVRVDGHGHGRCEDGRVSTDSSKHDESCQERSCLLRRVAELVPTSTGKDCVRVGIDGVDGSGKTVFADELADVLKIRGRGVVQISVDDFHNVSAVRYRRGRSSPEGFWLDSFNYERLRADVLEPLGPGGSRRYRSRHTTWPAIGSSTRHTRSLRLVRSLSSTGCSCTGMNWWVCGTSRSSSTRRSR